RTLRLPGTVDLALLQTRNDLVRVVERKAEPTAEIAILRQALQRAIVSFNRDRDREGRALGRDMIARVRRLMAIEGNITKRADAYRPGLLERVRSGVGERLDGAGATDGRPPRVTEERLVQEVALLVERADVTEELVRLRSHLAALMNLLRGSATM